MGIDAHVSSSAAQALSFAVRNMLFCFGVTILLGHSEVNDMDKVGVFGMGSTDQKVVRFDITINQILLVDCLDAAQLVKE